MSMRYAHDTVLNIGVFVRSESYYPGTTLVGQQGELCEVEYLPGHYPLVATFAPDNHGISATNVIMKDRYRLHPVRLGRASLRDRLVERATASFAPSHSEIRDCREEALAHTDGGETMGGRFSLRGGLVVERPLSGQPTLRPLDRNRYATIRMRNDTSGATSAVTIDHYRPVVVQERLDGTWQASQQGQDGRSLVQFRYGDHREPLHVSAEQPRLAGFHL